MEARNKILVVEDDGMVASVLERYLVRDGFAVRVVGDGGAALAEIADFEPDLVILDIMLPGLNGFEICRRMRRMGGTPIVVLSARGEESDRVMGLELGADDYIVKPFSNREVAARARAVLRRSASADHGRSNDPLRLVCGELVVDVAGRELSRAGVPIRIPHRELDLLIFLMRNAGRVFRREELMERVWGYRFGGTGTVTVHVQRLRERIEVDPANPLLIGTVWGVGYRFSAGSCDGSPSTVESGKAIVMQQPAPELVAEMLPE